MQCIFAFGVESINIDKLQIVFFRGLVNVDELMDGGKNGCPVSDVVAIPNIIALVLKS